MAFGTDVGLGTRICWLTDLGWMMGPWLIYGTLILGGTIVIYDGAPDFPDSDRLWQFCAKHKVEILGISPTLIRSLAQAGDDLPKRHDLSSLRAFASTGEPWNPAPWWWLFDVVGGGQLPIINYSGGTEIAGGILMGNPLLPLKPCSFPAPCLGMAADIWDDNGNQLGDGAVGEVAKDMGKPLAPSRIHFVKAIPKTRNAKIMRRVIRAAYLGQDPGDLSSLENRGALDEISSLRTV